MIDATLIPAWCQFLFYAAVLICCGIVWADRR